MLRKTTIHMKKIYLLLFICTAFCYSQNKKEAIVGTWKAVDYSGVENKMVFSVDNYVSMNINGEFLDGKNLVIKNAKGVDEKGFLKYEIDDSELPFKIDIIITKIENNKAVEKGRLMGILEFLNQDEAKINLGISGKREAAFNDSNKETTIRLQRN